MAMKIRVLNDVTADTTNRVNDAGLYASRNTIPLIARVLLSALFLWSGIGKILHPAATQDYMAAAGMPLTGFFLIAAIVQELGGGLLLLIGYKARMAAGILAGFTLIATFIFHTNLADQIQQLMFLKNLGIIGGLLMIVQYGAGNIAFRPHARR